MTAIEVNFDGLPGPTHNYAGLAFGNIAASEHAHQISNPRRAARQGLEKMKALMDMGLTQAVLPPHVRPDIAALKRLGFDGSDAAVLEAVARAEPELLHSVCSAAPMWAANVATISPSADCADGRVHITPANLMTNFHRSIEHVTTGRVLRAIFADRDHFAHHPALPSAPDYGDEGGANHTRLCTEYGVRGVELFVFGRSARRGGLTEPAKFPARQTLEACKAIARLHGLDPGKTVFAQQNPEAIDKGVFHNDVIAVGNRNVLLFHERAFADRTGVLDELRSKFEPGELELIEVKDSQITIDDAVTSYLFNSQLVCPPGEPGMALIVPMEAVENERVKAYLDWLAASNHPIDRIHPFDLRQSMRNGGGPACLRLRVVLSGEELASANPGVFLDRPLHDRLAGWIDSHYRDRLSTGELADPALLAESRTALDELTQILSLGSVYDFQRAE